MYQAEEYLKGVLSRPGGATITLDAKVKPLLRKKEIEVGYRPSGYADGQHDAAVRADIRKVGQRLVGDADPGGVVEDEDEVEESGSWPTWSGTQGSRRKRGEEEGRQHQGALRFGSDRIGLRTVVVATVLFCS